jgi:hypothetical protein
MAMQPTKAPQPMGGDELNKRVAQIGDMFRRVQVSDNKGRETDDVKRVDKAYKEFENVLERQSEFMEHASKEQKEVLDEVVAEFAKMRKEGKVDYDRFHKEMEAAVSRINEVGGNQKAKEGIELAAAVGMKHSDPDNFKKKGNVLKQELHHRAAKIFTPNKDDLESPLFRKLAGLDRKDPSKMISPLERARILGQGEALKKAASDGITGEGSAAEAMAKTMGGSGDGKGAFPSKIENLHVENLIVKNARREEAPEAPRYTQPALNGPHAGKSAAALNPQLEGPGGSGAMVHPQLPSGVDPERLRLKDETYHAPQLEHRQPLRLSGPKHEDVQDVEFKEAPIKVKSRNPHAPLRTKETTMASAVRGAIDAAPILSPRGGVVDAVRGSGFDNNDVSDRSADATLHVDNGEGVAAGAGDSPIPGLLATAATALFGRKPKANEEEKTKANEEEKASGEEKTKGNVEEKAKTGSDAEKVKPVEEGAGKGLAAEGEALAGDAKGLSKFVKVGSKIGKVAGIAGMALTAYDSYGQYNDADKALAAGKITAQQAKEQKAHAVGGGVGSVVGGYIGSTIGGIAGSFVAPGVGTLAGGAAGGYLGSKAGEWVGDKLGSWWAKPSDQEAAHTVHQAAQAHAAASKAPVVIHAPTTQAAPAAAASAKPIPIKAEPRSRESYFDRQMMNTVMF